MKIYIKLPGEGELFYQTEPMREDTREAILNFLPSVGVLLFFLVFCFITR